MKKIDPNTIVEKVAQYYSQELYELQSTTKRRNRELVRTRQVTFFFLREMTNMSLARIGWIYSKDHATILHACRQVRNLYETDKIYKAEIDELRGIILKHHDLKDRMSYHYDLMSMFGKQLIPQSI
jgi:chromosomal replication initiator protein